jgi:hypothetical protein
MREWGRFNVLWGGKAVVSCCVVSDCLLFVDWVVHVLAGSNKKHLQNL